jgi:predicted type IV restriction endonuclease
MHSLNLPPFDAKVKRVDGKTVIFDVIRRRYVALTPEEWVRQHFVNYLLREKGYPQALLANEVQIKLNNTIKRCDTVLYRRDLTARMIVEYKAPEIEITQAVFDQITRYNMALRVDYLIVSNGIKHYCCLIDYKENRYTFLQDIPMYAELKG